MSSALVPYKVSDWVQSNRNLTGMDSRLLLHTERLVLRESCYARIWTWMPQRSADFRKSLNQLNSTLDKRLRELVI
jgi:hypothetical protein